MIKRLRRAFRSQGQRESQVGLIDVAGADIIVHLLKGLRVLRLAPAGLETVQGGRPGREVGRILGRVIDPELQERQAAVPGHERFKPGFQREAQFVTGEPGKPCARALRGIQSIQCGGHLRLQDRFKSLNK